MSIEVSLPRGQRRRPQQVVRNTRSRIEALRARVLLLLDEGLAVSEVALRVDCARATVYRTVYRFEAYGEEAARDRRSRREPAKVTPEVEQMLLSYLDAVPGDYGWERANGTLDVLQAAACR